MRRSEESLTRSLSARFNSANPGAFSDITDSKSIRLLKLRQPDHAAFAKGTPE